LNQGAKRVMLALTNLGDSPSLALLDFGLC
jgi:hypothetical protein